MLQFIYSEKATKFCEIFTLLLTTVHTVKSNLKISWPSQNIGTSMTPLKFVIKKLDLHVKIDLTAVFSF